MSFHFTSSAPSAQLVSDVGTLNSWPVAALESFSGVMLAFLSQAPAQEALLAQFLAANPALKPKARAVLTSMLTFFSASMRTGGGGGALNGAHVQADLVGLGLSEDRAKLLSQGFLSSMGEVSQAAIERTLHAAELVDVQWKFGVVASSSEQQQIGACFLQLSMLVDEGGHKKQRVMELSLPQFYQFLQQMQLANRQMQSLTK